MWYVVWVKTGEEQTVLQMCANLFGGAEIIRTPNRIARKDGTRPGPVSHARGDGSVFRECFIPLREIAYRCGKEWTTRTQVLFPGYLFFITDDALALHEKLKTFPEYARLLGDGDGPIPLQPSEIEFLRDYTDEERVVRMSTAEMIGQELVVISGPLSRHRGKVVYINRRGRYCTIETEFMGRTVRINLGLDVVRKVSG